MERQPRGRRELEAASVAQPPLLQKTKKENPREVGRGREVVKKHPVITRHCSTKQQSLTKVKICFGKKEIL